MKYIGLDYGSKTVGIALADEAGQIPRGVLTVRRKNEKRLRQTCAKIEEIIVAEDVGAIVLGLPLNMDGTEGERAEKARLFGDMLRRRTGLPVYYTDERLTTVEAHSIMDETGIKDEKERTERVDNIAAALILEDFFRNREK